jgi:hypothetical protein
MQESENNLLLHRSAIRSTIFGIPSERLDFIGIFRGKLRREGDF